MRRYAGFCCVSMMFYCAAAASGFAQQEGHRKPRARDLGIPFDGTPGPLNAITDVAGVEVGFATLISGEGPRVVGKGPVRTGVTAIFPRGKEARDSAFAGTFVLNGNGEMTGTAWIDESGFLDGPVLITNTHCVFAVRDAVIASQIERGRPPRANSTPTGTHYSALPEASETAHLALDVL